ncbi:hypothetical protein EK21DRAFT_97486 [Setomelanomma holmii]|uniref:Uncharacterized protein n=1 Tax=Setomelanomma holmii TaxID=210430 RepID=A0A9P4HJZ3_9PLEO|nr:hypothetical protein EK21DRAFT_97486 [Setomelanomma holmii]
MSANPSHSRSPSIPRITRSPRSPPLHHFDDPPEDESHEHEHPDDDLDDGQIPYPEASSEQTLLPPPNFQPFFTLIEDTTSGEHYHPYVHYVFADDDPVTLTAASMRGLGLDDTKYLPHDAQSEDERHDAQEEGSEDGDDSPVESPLPPPIPGVKEHYLIVDLSADGRTVVDAQSLSSEWQITDTNIRIAPSFDESSPDQGYMLRIEGLEVPGKNKGKGKGQAGNDRLSEARDKCQGDLFGALDSLVQDIEGGLKVAAKIGSRRSAEEQGTVTDVRTAQEEKSVTGDL